MSDQLPQYADWSDIKVDILALIVPHLASKDKPAFKAVCQQWLKTARMLFWFALGPHEESPSSGMPRLVCFATGSTYKHLAVASTSQDVSQLLTNYSGLTSLQLMSDAHLAPQSVPDLFAHSHIKSLCMDAPTFESKRFLYGLEGLTIWLQTSADLDWSKFSCLKRLQLGSERLELAEMKCLTIVSSLEALRLFCCPSEDCLRGLPRLTRLQFITGDTDLDDLEDSLRALHYLTCLKDLHIEGHLSNSQVAGLGRKRSLTSLEINTFDTPICNVKAMAALCRLTNLQRLYCPFLHSSVCEARLGHYLCDSEADWYVYVPGLATKIAVNKAIVNRSDPKRPARDFVTGLAI